jgi:hypothetical protein
MRIFSFIEITFDQFFNFLNTTELIVESMENQIYWKLIWFSKNWKDDDNAFWQTSNYRGTKNELLSKNHFSLKPAGFNGSSVHVRAPNGMGQSHRIPSHPVPSHGTLLKKLLSYGMGWTSPPMRFSFSFSHEKL